MFPILSSEIETSWERVFQGWMVNVILQWSYIRWSSIQSGDAKSSSSRAYNLSIESHPWAYTANGKSIKLRISMSQPSSVRRPSSADLHNTHFFLIRRQALENDAGQSRHLGKRTLETDYTGHRRLLLFVSIINKRVRTKDNCEDN